MEDLKALDEALDYLNETELVTGGIIRKLIDYKNKKKKEKAEKYKNDKLIKERGYTDKQYEWCKDDLKSWNDIYESDGAIGLIDNMDMYGDCLYYLSIKESEMTNAIAKYAKDNKIELDDIEIEEYLEDRYGENSKQVNLVKNDIYVSVADNGGGDNLLFFLKSKKFYQWYHEGWELEEISYSGLIECGKRSFNTNGTDINAQYAKAYKAADEKLGYNRLK